jgi:uncharacterized protein (DUF2164 family)
MLLFFFMKGNTMTKAQIVKKIKRYLELDTTKNTNEDARRYAEQLLEWINIWEKR